MWKVFLDQWFVAVLQRNTASIDGILRVKSYSDKIVKEYPVLSIEFTHLGEADHFDELESSPDKVDSTWPPIEVLTEDVHEQKEHHRPEIDEQVGKILAACAQDNDTDAEQYENKHWLGGIRVLDDIHYLLHKVHQPFVVTILLTSVEYKTDSLERLDLLLGFAGFLCEDGTGQRHLRQVLQKDVDILVVLNHEIHDAQPVL